MPPVASVGVVKYTATLPLAAESLGYDCRKSKVHVV